MSINTKNAVKQCVDENIYQIDIKKSSISNKHLIEIAKSFGDIFKTENDPPIYHEIAETAANYLMKEKYAKELLNSSNPNKEVNRVLKPVCERFPTQTWRSYSQIIRQQFSTPPQIAFFLTYLLNLKIDEEVLEPSAGTGCLAVWASGFGLRVFTNEIDARRRDLLEFLGYKPTSFNAEYIHDYLPPKIKPDVLIMNPPFSSNGGRTRNNSSKFGFQHVYSSLERLKPGGKFGIILGNSAGLDTRTGRKFWQGLFSIVNIKAIIKIDGREYYKYDTSVDVNLITGVKYLNPQEKSSKTAINAVRNLSIESIEEGFAVAQSSNLRLD